MYKKAIYDLATGFTLRNLHDESRLPREKVADVLEIDELTVTRIEIGEDRMSAGDLVLLLDLFDVTWDEFLAKVKSNLAKAEAALS
ncbi:MAG: helix-turn-helix domain-containing protein [Hyphomicrobiaceae bacterium]